MAQFDFEYCIDKVLRHEGGYVNDPADRGGETNMGITKATAIAYKRLWVKYNWDGNMKTLPVQLAKEIYKQGYWTRNRCDDLFDIYPFLAYHVFDWGINTGVKRAAQQLQDAVGVDADGIIGQGTLAAVWDFVDTFGGEYLAEVLLDKQQMFYDNLVARKPVQKKFLKGWTNRVNDKRKLLATV